MFYNLHERVRILKRFYRAHKKLIPVISFKSSFCCYEMNEIFLSTNCWLLQKRLKNGSDVDDIAFFIFFKKLLSK